MDEIARGTATAALTLQSAHVIHSPHWRTDKENFYRLFVRRCRLLLDCRLQVPRQCRAQRPDVLEFDAAAPADDLHAPAHPVLCLGDEFLG
jgi:hypothetical protein